MMICKSYQRRGERGRLAPVPISEIWATLINFPNKTFSATINSKVLLPLVWWPAVVDDNGPLESRT